MPGARSCPPGKGGEAGSGGRGGAQPGQGAAGVRPIPPRPLSRTAPGFRAEAALGGLAGDVLIKHASLYVKGADRVPRGPGKGSVGQTREKDRWDLGAKAGEAGPGAGGKR